MQAKERKLRNASRIDWVILAVGAALVMLLYFTLANHVDLYPFNNLADAGSQWPSTRVGWIQFIIFIVLLLIRRRLAAVSALIISLVWISLQFRQWYLPYLFNVGPTDWYLENGYAETTKILPSISGHVVTPDLQHNLLQILSLAVAFCAAMAVRQIYSGRQTRLK